MAMKAGDRAGAILGVANGVVSFFGFGVYKGSQVPVEAAGWMAKSLVEANVGNPCIELDSGKKIYGCECWWGSESGIQDQLDAATEVIDVDIDEVRKKWQEDEEL